MLAMLAAAVPRLGVDRARGAAALAGGALATDEVMRRVEAAGRSGAAYREVSRRARAGATLRRASPARLLARRRSTGGLGNLGLGRGARRLRRGARLERSASAGASTRRCDARGPQGTRRRLGR